MVTFFIGLAILLVGGFFYSKLAVRVFGPDDRKTPCYTKADGVDFVPMPCWKNSLI
ncbi:MAG: carbon starvation protein A, partial [Lachnospiraceae bacterium]